MGRTDYIPITMELAWVDGRLLCYPPNACSRGCQEKIDLEPYLKELIHKQTYSRLNQWIRIEWKQKQCCQ